MKAVTIAWKLMYTHSLYGTPDMVRQGVILDEIGSLVDAGLLFFTATTTFGALAPDTLRAAREGSEGGNAIGKVVLPGIEAHQGGDNERSHRQGGCDRGGARRGLCRVRADA